MANLITMINKKGKVRKVPSDNEVDIQMWKSAGYSIIQEPAVKEIKRGNK